ncbi:hypothetical protein LMH87_000598 [Akanthomyces muscarius]|uniref:RRM domain-containing protein n=1 Tax=Akanthomyces muscarius TaxID=2231603 RepID=A0A9W8UP06_AKAMU|nr:hypothetical protein LMH87_000598 [Akanthomyces muscarius]KAJ4155345.1 hypothetical protein LMH87_000598 [Akanthomyces muscarius]
MSNEVSNTRLYLGNLPPNATKADIEAHFATHGTGEITEVKLMHGFGFIEYKDPMDARDVVPAFHGSDFKGTRLTVQFARGPRPREPPGYAGGGHHERAPPRPRRTVHRMTITGLPNETSWQDLKDFGRQAGLDVVYSETARDSGRGFVEYENAGDLRTAVEKLDGCEFKGKVVQCIVDTQAEVPTSRQRGRSRSPGRRPYNAPPFDDRPTDTENVALAATITTTEPDTTRLPGARWRTILRPLDREDTTTSRTAATIRHPRHLDRMEVAPTTALRLPETSHPAKARRNTPEMGAMAGTMTVVDATDDSRNEKCDAAVQKNV